MNALKVKASATLRQDYVKLERTIAGQNAVHFDKDLLHGFALLRPEQLPPMGKLTPAASNLRSQVSRLAVFLYNLPMHYPNWTYVAEVPKVVERLPAKAENSNLSERVLAVVGFTEPTIVLAAYDHAREAWVGDDTYAGVYGIHDENVVTHWAPLPPLPDRVPSAEVAAYFQTVEPDYKPGVIRHRALFQAVDPADKELQVKLRDAIGRTGFQGTAIITRGILNGREYFVDFAVYDAVQLQNIKATLNLSGEPYSILARPESGHL